MLCEILAYSIFIALKARSQHHLSHVAEYYCSETKMLTLFMENFMSKIYHYKHFTKFTRYDKRLAEIESECLSHDLNTVPIITSPHVELLE